jgi:hypothetical protein
MRREKRDVEALTAALRMEAAQAACDPCGAALVFLLHEAADTIDALRGEALTITRGDLEALVAAFAREHFSYNDGGAAALRVYHTLAEAVETDAPAIAILAPSNQPTTPPQRTDQ